MTYTSQDKINGLQPDDDDVEIDYNRGNKEWHDKNGYMGLAEMMDMIRDPDCDAHWEGRSFVWTQYYHKDEEGFCPDSVRMVETFPYKYVKKCTDCLHGWCRDVPPYGDDEECWRCDGTGYLKND